MCVSIFMCFFLQILSSCFRGLTNMFLASKFVPAEHLGNLLAVIKVFSKKPTYSLVFIERRYLTTLFLELHQLQRRVISIQSRPSSSSKRHRSSTD